MEAVKSRAEVYCYAILLVRIGLTNCNVAKLKSLVGTDSFYSERFLIEKMCINVQRFF